MNALLTLLALQAPSAPPPCWFAEPGRLPRVRASTTALADREEEDEEEESEEDWVDDLGPEPAVTATASGGGPRYTRDLDDDTLRERWTNDRASLGSVAVGSPDAGRLVNGRPFPTDSRWIVVDPPNTFATEEAIAALTGAIGKVHDAFPDTMPARVNHISASDGGYLPPHATHQVGRDVDLGFYYTTPEAMRRRPREKALDPARNWALLRALITDSDVELILVDHRVQRVLYDHALALGEDKAWLDGLFKDGRRSLFQHARRHRDHFHIRFYSPRAQELGRRVQPWLGEDEKQPQLVRHRVRNGDSLSVIARRYGVTISALKRTNRLRSDFIRAGRVLAVPVRGNACTRCADMPEVVVPPRRLPPKERPLDKS